MEYIIIGSGVAGMTAAKTIREYDRDGEITVYTDEFHPLGLYARKDLARRLASELVDPDELLLEIEVENIRVQYDEVVRVVPHMRQIMRPHYARHVYDRLLIASGAAPRLVDAPGLHYIGVHQLRNYEDAALVDAWIPMLQQTGAVVIGGGILGMDTAYALAQRGVQATLVVREHRLGTKLLSEGVAEIAEEILRASGVEILFGETLAAYLSEDERLLDGVKLHSGRIIPARMALSAVGVRSRTEFLDDSGIAIDESSGAIRVNAQMETNLATIYAAGNCAVVDDEIAWNWEQSAEQGRIAGLNMVGQFATYHPIDTQKKVTPLALEGVYQST